VKNFFDKLKGAWRSKTIWFNVGAGIALTYSNEILGVLPQLQPVLGADHYQTAFAVVTVVNVTLRFLTKHPLEAK